MNRTQVTNQARITASLTTPIKNRMPSVYFSMATSIATEIQNRWREFFKKQYDELRREQIAARPENDSIENAQSKYDELLREHWFKAGCWVCLRWAVPWIHISVADTLVAFRMLSSRDRKNALRRRWRRHLAMHACFPATDPINPNEAANLNATSGVLCAPIPTLRFIETHLNVLDTKFASLLGFLALLATGVGVVLSRQDLDSIKYLRWSVVGVLAIDVLLCLRGSLRVGWGELGATNHPTEAWEEHLRSLVDLLITRTARFRVATMLTAIAVVLVLWFLATATIKIPPTETPHPPLASVGAPTIITFNSGETCSTRPELVRQLESVVARAKTERWRSVLLQASADALSVRADAAFGGNIGIATTRAKCVAGWIVDAGPIEVRIELIDNRDRTQDAKTRGAETDRFVAITGYRYGDAKATSSISGSPH